MAPRAIDGDEGCGILRKLDHCSTLIGQRRSANAGINRGIPDQPGHPARHSGDAISEAQDSRNTSE
jgi:hypothetical protein